MSEGDGEQSADPVLGTEIEDAVDAIGERDPEADPESVRAALDLVVEDGTVTRSGVESALAETAKHVATPENRLELAGEALESAREAAAPVADLDAVASRLDGFEARYRAIEADVDDLLARLDDLAGRADEPGNVHDLARSMRAVRADARDAHRRADDLAADLESFEVWLDDPGVRFEELEADVERAEEFVAELAEAVAELDAAVPGHDDPARAWADAVLRHRLVGLLAADLRAELADLRTWVDRATERAADPTERAGEIEGRIDDLRAREAELGDRVDALARPAWRDRYGEDVAAFEADLDDLDPPVDWSEVNAVLAERRSSVVESTR